MANETINDVAANKFTDMFHLEAQQVMSKTMSYVDFRVMNNSEFFAYDRFGRVRAQEAETRSPTIEFSDTDFTRRQIAKRVFYVPVPLYEEDVNNMLADPQSPIIQACIAELNRVKDRIVTEAAIGDVKTGKGFETTVSFANDDGLTVDATAGVTYDKALELRQNFKQRDVRSTKIGFLMSEQEEESLMKETELTSGDFTRFKPVDSGSMIQGLGMDFVTFGSGPIDNDPILDVTSSIRSNIAIARTDTSSGVVMGISKDITVQVQERPDLLNTKQIVVSMSMGAVRSEGALVQKFTSTAT